MQCCNCMPQIHISREQLQIHKYKNTKIHTNIDKRMHKCTAWTVSRASIKKPAAWNGFGQKGWFVLHSSPAVKVVRKIILFYTSPTSGNDLGTWEHNCMHKCENECAIYLCVCTAGLWLISSGDAQLLRRVDLDSELGLTKPTHILLFTPFLSLLSMVPSQETVLLLWLSMNRLDFFWRFVDCQW